MVYANVPAADWKEVKNGREKNVRELQVVHL